MERTIGVGYLPLRILVSGDRNWNEPYIVADILMKIKKSYGISLVVHGGASGSDTIAKFQSEAMGIPTKEFKANWERYGKGAGPKRNKQMLDEAKPDLVICFHDNLSRSKGTKNMVKLCIDEGVAYIVYNRNGRIIHIGNLEDVKQWLE